MLHEAADLGDLEFAEDLPARGIDTSAKDRCGRTALDLARERKQAPPAAWLEWATAHPAAKSSR